MKTIAAVLYEMGKPRPYANSRPLQVEAVELEGPGAGEVLVRVEAAALCHSDLSVIDGSRPRVMPMVLGHEAAGIVQEIGPGVQGLNVGDPVVFSFVPMCGRCIYCATGRPALCENGNKANAGGMLLGGQRRFKNAQGEPLHHHLGVSGFSQYTVAAQESLIKIDPAIPLDEAVVFSCAIVTGLGVVVNTAKVGAGMSVAIFGLGGVGLSIVMGAALVGAYPIIAVDMLKTKLDLARNLGATHTVDSSDGDPVQAVKKIVSGGVDYSFEAVGSAQVLIQAYQATCRGGTTVTVGLPPPNREFVVPAVSIVVEERIIMGSYMGSAVPRRDIPRYLALYQAGKLRADLLISRSLSLEFINEGFDSLASGEVIRQVVRF